MAQVPSKEKAPNFIYVKSIQEINWIFGEDALSCLQLQPMQQKDSEEKPFADNSEAHEHAKPEAARAEPAQPAQAEEAISPREKPGRSALY